MERDKYMIGAPFPMPSSSQGKDYTVAKVIATVPGAARNKVNPLCQNHSVDETVVSSNSCRDCRIDLTQLNRRI